MEYNSTIGIEAEGPLDFNLATLAASQAVDLSGLDISAMGSSITAAPHYLGKVDFHASGFIQLDGATINATKEVDVDAGTNLFGNDVVMNANGHSQGTIDLDAGGDLYVERANLKARKFVELEAVDSIFATASKLLAQGDVFSEVRAAAGVDLLLTDAVIRARERIDLTAAGVADLTRSASVSRTWEAVTSTSAQPRSS